MVASPPHLSKGVALGNRNTLNWNENDIRRYLSEEFPDAGQDLINTVTQAVMNEGKDRIKNILSMYRSTHTFRPLASFRNVDRDQWYHVASMMEGVHRRFVGGTYEFSG